MDKNIERKIIEHEGVEPELQENIDKTIEVVLEDIETESVEDTSRPIWDYPYDKDGIIKLSEGARKILFKYRVRNNDPICVRWVPNKRGNPVKWAREYKEGNWKVAPKFYTADDIRDIVAGIVATIVALFIIYALVQSFLVEMGYMVLY